MLLEDGQEREDQSRLDVLALDELQHRSIETIIALENDMTYLSPLFLQQILLQNPQRSEQQVVMLAVQ